MTKVYRNKQEAEEAGFTAETIYLNKNLSPGIGNRYLWRECEGCKKIKLIKFGSVTCSKKCYWILSRPIDYEETVQYKW